MSEQVPEEFGGFERSPELFEALMEGLKGEWATGDGASSGSEGDAARTPPPPAQ